MQQASDEQTLVASSQETWRRPFCQLALAAMGDEINKVHLTQEAAISMEAQAYQKYSTMKCTKTRKTSDYVENFQPLCRPLSNNNGKGLSLVV